jgi:pimeloyl-ACP methyl ester carboxylesterase
VPEGGRFDIETSGLDVSAVVHWLGLKEYVLMGYSLGAAIIADGYRHLAVKPRQMIFLEPTPVFHYPRVAIKMARLTRQLKTMPLKIITKWYIRNFIIDKNADADMVQISAKAIDNCDPVKLKKTIVAIAGYTLWDKLAGVNCPVLVIAATKDKFHRHDETLRLLSMLENSSYVDLETNRRSHSAEAAEVIRTYLVQFTR